MEMTRAGTRALVPCRDQALSGSRPGGRRLMLKGAKVDHSLLCRAWVRTLLWADPSSAGILASTTWNGKNVKCHSASTSAWDWGENWPLCQESLPMMGKQEQKHLLIFFFHENIEKPETYFSFPHCSLFEVFKILIFFPLQFSKKQNSQMKLHYFLSIGKMSHLLPREQSLAT